MTNALKYHSIADLFPMLEGENFDNLVNDIKANGLLEPIWTYEGKILDGRNRYMACAAAEIQPKLREYKGNDPAGFVLSLNLERRHLTPTQRAFIALDLVPFYEQAAKERQRKLNNKETASVTNDLSETGKSVDFAAAKVHVSSGYVANAKEVQEAAPELAAEARAGLIHMKEAMREVKDQKRTDKRAKLAAAGAKVKPSDRWKIHHDTIENIELKKQFDFIITDPPYPKKFLPLYETLAVRSNEWLKGGGLLVAMCGQSYLNKIYAMMSKHLTYYWTAAYLTPGQPTPLRQVNVNTTWKPLLIFRKGAYKGKIFGDVFVSDGNDKSMHKWGQSESGMYSIISKMCLEGQSILDPFCGAGTTGVAALKFGCLFEGIEKEKENVDISMARLSE